MLDQINLDLWSSQFYLNYIPLLSAISLIVLLLPLKSMAWQTSLVRSLGILLASGITFGFYWVDQHFGLWSKLDLTYNAPTALAMSLVIFLVVYARYGAWLFMLSLVSYLLLVVLNQDASFLSVATTGLVIIPLMTGLFGASTYAFKHIQQ